MSNGKAPSQTLDEYPHIHMREDCCWSHPQGFDPAITSTHKIYSIEEKRIRNFKNNNFFFFLILPVAGFEPTNQMAPRQDQRAAARGSSCRCGRVFLGQEAPVTDKALRDTHTHTHTHTAAAQCGWWGAAQLCWGGCEGASWGWVGSKVY